jgi:selenium metabolism protein YedF
MLNSVLSCRRTKEMNINTNLLLILKSSGLGDGEPDLGLKLMNSFLDMLLESDDIPSRIICMGTGIYLTTFGSPVEKQMNQLAEAGCEILSCSTCLEYYGRKDSLFVGKATTMKDTVRAMMEFKKVLFP